MDEKPSLVPRSVGGRVLYGLVATLLPVLCFLLAEGLKPEWQSGLLSDYAAILLGPTVTLYFAPLLLYAVGSLVLLLIAPQRFARVFAVRLGIYGGFLLALQYTVLLGIYLGTGSVLIPIVGDLFLCAAPPVVSWGSGFVRRRYGDQPARFAALGVIGLCLVLIVVSILLAGGAVLGFLVVVLLAGAPCWCLDIAAVVSFRLLRDYEFKVPLSAWHLVGPLAWMGALGVAWRLAVLRMWAVYATLPPQPPDCYVATAAARGHARLVKSWPATAQDGRPFRVNRQMQRLKCAELALQAAWPAGHRLLRRAYDALGPRLAGRLRSPLLADLAYLLLKPAEWGGWAVLRALLPEAGVLAGHVYGAPGKLTSARVIVYWTRDRRSPSPHPRPPRALANAAAGTPPPLSALRRGEGAGGEERR